MTLKEYLISSKITQAAFAEEVRCSRQYITAICSKKRLPGLRMLNRIVGASHGEIRMEEAMKEFRPDLLKMFKGEVTSDLY